MRDVAESVHMKELGAAASFPVRVDQDRDGADVTVVVPVSERPASLVELYREYSAPLQSRGEAYEFIFVAEPWFRELTATVARLASEGEPVKVYEVGQPVGESVLLRVGASRASGGIIITLPAYLRVEAAALPRLVDAVRRGADLAVARRWPRRDSWVNRVQGRTFHMLIKGLAQGRLRDVACGVRALRKDVLEEVPLYGDFCRFLPLFALRRGLDVVEIDAPQHQLDLSPRVYRPGVYLRRLIDILGLFFLLRFTDKPLRFFGLIVLGFQAIALGLVGEIIVHLRASRHPTHRVVAQ